jgi:polyhydroxyalkanoate synthesis repressor PhaR
MKTIKRYSNRKLYDTEAGCYVTLEDLADMIRRDEEIRVVDHASGADLTSVTLFQILFEQQKALGGMLPERMLTRVIGAGDSALNSLRGAFRAFLEPVEHIEDDIRRRLEILKTKGVVTEEEFQHLSNLLLDPDLRVPVETPSRHEKLDPDAVTYSRMLDQVEELEKTLESLRKAQEQKPSE